MQQNTIEMATGKHPKGLYFLFFSELWERFGYYLMLGIFSLFMIDSVQNGGMGFSPEKKSDIYGTYLGLVYLTPFIGGLLADRIIGYRKSIIAGGLLMSAGYFCLAIPGNQFFYIALMLVIIGNGFFKPNISTLVGNLYNDSRYNANKDSGYSIFYMGINIGAFVCNFIAAYMRNNLGWGWAFGAAGVGMFIGVLTFISGTKHLKHADIKKPAQKEDMSLAKIFGMVLLPMVVFGIIGFIVPNMLLGHTIFGTQSNDAFLFGCLPVIIFYFSLWKRASAEDKNGIGALLAVFACVIIFWAVFHQNGDALTIWAKDYTNREMPAGLGQVADKIGMAQHATYDTAAIKESYFQNLPATKRPAPGKSLLLFSTELYQSINPFWVVILTPVVVGFWNILRKKKKEPSTPLKIAIGLFVTGLSALVMVAAVSVTQMGDEKASSWWLIMSYCVISFGELCLSPMGLSLVSKLSPPRLTSLLMGGWFLSTSVGNKLSGMLSGLWERFEDKSHFFLMNFGLCLAATLLLLSLVKWLNKVMQEKGLY